MTLLDGRTRTVAAALLAFALAAPLSAQQGVQTAGARTLSLQQALEMAEAASEPVTIARAGITRARGVQLQARSARLPQVSGNLSYSRALASEFSSIGGGETDTTTAPPLDCGRFTPGTSTETRLDSLEKAVRCASNPFASLGDLPFGRENTWRYGLTVSQTLFAGGAIAAQNRMADAGRRSAQVELASQRAQLALNVTQAYYDAALSDRIVAISEATLAQAEETLRQTQLARQVGNQPEFDLLRAQVARDNARPAVIQSRAIRDMAYLSLKQLLDLPVDAPLRLTTPLDTDQVVPVVHFASNEQAMGDTTPQNRAPVRQLLEVVNVQREAVRVADAQRLPSVGVQLTYGRVAYPTGAFPGFDEFRTNATVTAGLTVPLFTGGRIRGQRMVAQAELIQTEMRLRQAVELARLENRSALENLEAAQASWAASTGTVEQASRAYRIAEIRYREGISTQIEVADSRILLQQAEANRARAARDLAVARARVALMPDLPFGSVSQGNTANVQATQQPQAGGTQQQQGGQGAPAGGATDPSQAAFTGAGR
jgi:outer membrane protein